VERIIAKGKKDMPNPSKYFIRYHKMPINYSYLLFVAASQPFAAIGLASFNGLGRGIDDLVAVALVFATGQHLIRNGIPLRLQLASGQIGSLIMPCRSNVN